jgi:hypothetical protein
MNLPFFAWQAWQWLGQNGSGQKYGIFTPDNWVNTGSLRRPSHYQIIKCEIMAPNSSKHVKTDS